MTNEDKPEYTVFYSTGFLCTGGRDGDTLEELVALGDKNFVPEVWSPEVPVILGGSKFAWQLREESIAAGRVIKLIDGKYVPFGLDAVPVEEKEEGVFLAGPDATFKEVVEALIDLHAEMAEPKRAPLDWNKSTPFDPFKGYVVKSDTGHIEHTPSPLTLSTDMEPASHQVKPSNGSAYLKG
jgi:hypothetical protein